MPTERHDLQGSLPDYVVKGLKADTNGIFSGSAVRHFEVGNKNQRIDKRWLTRAAAPDPFGGLPFVNATAEIDAPLVIVTYNFGGIEAGFEADDDTITFELDTSMAEEPIETHPNFVQLAKLYGWDQTVRMFAQLMPTNGQQGKTALSSGKKSKGKANPLFGTDSWLAIGVVYKKTYASSVIPGWLWEGIGTIVSKPPDIGKFHLPAESKKRNWLKLAPLASQIGRAHV